MKFDVHVIRNRPFVVEAPVKGCHHYHGAPAQDVYHVFDLLLLWASIELNSVVSLVPIGKNKVNIHKIRQLYEQKYYPRTDWIKD